jgi:hypothetical protein
MNKGPGALGCRAPWLGSDKGPRGLNWVHPPKQIPDMEWPVKKKNLLSSFPL